MRRLFGLLLIALMICGCSYRGDEALKPQTDTTTNYFKNRPFTALVDFEVHGFYFVDSEGKPLSEEDQSKRKGSKGLFTKDFTVEKGKKGHIFALGQTDERIVTISVSEGTTLFTAAWNPSHVEIHYSRPITKEDLTPEAIARALSSLLVIDGLEPGSELDDLLDDLN